MMKTIISIITVCFIATSVSANEGEGQQLARALALGKAGKYEEASAQLFQMSLNPVFRPYQMQIKYILGLMLLEMKMYQVAAFEFVDVIREGNNKYIRESLGKLVMAADALNDDTLLNYALSRIQLNQFPADKKDLLYYRVGEYYYRKGLNDKAVEYLKDVAGNSRFFSKAKYLQGLALAESNKIEEATLAFKQLYQFKSKTQVTNASRVGALMGLARVAYQKKNWDQAIDYYRDIPRDTEMWHDSLFEMSWAQMRSAKFRSVLSNFHSMHSSFYEDFFLPESVLLRSIVYLYICQYDEMEKTLNLFDRLYQPMLRNMIQFLKSNNNPASYHAELEKGRSLLERLKKNPDEKRTGVIPFAVTRTILKEGDVQRTFGYIQNLRKEVVNFKQRSDSWQQSSIGRFSNKVISARLKTAEARVGRQARLHLIRLAKDLRDLFEQQSYAKYELLNSKKEFLKKKIAAKGIIPQSVDEKSDRSYYIQNGFEYWPFRGEYWLDEIGNYYYLGTQRCE